VGTKGVVVGRVGSTYPHPGGERIWLADVDIGTGMPRIIWGGVPILVKGTLVPVAQPGTWLPPTKSKPGPYKIRCRNHRCRIRQNAAEGLTGLIFCGLVLQPDLVIFESLAPVVVIAG
jgi:hypothetical protein